MEDQLFTNLSEALDVWVENTLPKITSKPVFRPFGAVRYLVNDALDARAESLKINADVGCTGNGGCDFSLNGSKLK